MTYTAGLIFVCVLGSAAAVAQEPSSPGPGPEAAAPSTAQAVAPETPISLPQVGKNVLFDQKPIFTFPWQVVRGRHWKPVLAVVIGTAALVALDPHTEPYFHNSSGFASYKTGPLRGRNTTLAITLAPAAFFVTGLALHDTHARNTGLLAAEVVADTQLLAFAMKHAVGRLVPSGIPPQGNLRDTWFKYGGTFSNGGSFPSGHAASAFAVATVIAARSRHHRWMPWVAYGTATFIALTRLPDRAHFPSDIFIGAAMGYGVGRLALLGRHKEER